MSWMSDDLDQRGWHDVAQICLNGHVINDSTRASPEFNQKFCQRCGQPTITECQNENCKKPIPGDYHVPGVYGGPSLLLPAFCINCGAAYPWTQSRLKAAHELALDNERLDDRDKEVLSKSLDDLVKDNPSTPVAANRFKRIMSKVGKEGAGAFRDILVDIASETAKKIIWPNQP